MIVVVGSGTMGSGIATSFLAAGQDVRLIDLDDGLLAAARHRIVASLRRLANRDSALDVEGALQRLSAATAHEHSDCALVIEAVPENIALKQAVLSAVEPLCSGDTLIATNTSSLSPTEMASALQQPDRFLGMHFFNPVPVSSLVEVVAARSTSAAAIEKAKDWVRLLGKTPIVVRDHPGFASSRLGLALGLEAIRMVAEGVACTGDIDTAMRLGYKHPIGPLELTDLVGLDVRLAIAEHLEAELGPRFSPPSLLREMVERGDLGKKTGKGFYDW